MPYLSIGVVLRFAKNNRRYNGPEKLPGNVALKTVWQRRQSAIDLEAGVQFFISFQDYGLKNGDKRDVLRS